MTATACALRTLHRIHQQLSELRARRERGPKQIRAREQNVANLESELNQARENARKARMAADEKQLELSSIESKIRDWKAQLNSCSSNREYQALLEQIAAAEMAGSVLSDEILELFERLDSLGGAIDNAKTRMEKTAQELERARGQVAADAGTIASDISRLEKELANAEATLPSDFRVDYDRVVRARGTDGLAVVEETCCCGCYQQITPNMQNQLALGRSVPCEGCGRLLYQAGPESSG